MDSDDLRTRLDEVEDACAELRAAIRAERSFHKVYLAVGGLLFLYGLVYGVGLCPK